MAGVIDRVRCYFGLGLPSRELPLNFNLPRMSSKLRAKNSGNADLMRDLDEAKGVPVDYFRLLMNEVKHINRCAMKPSQRLELTREITDLFYPLALAQIAVHAKTGGIPESEDRRLALKGLIDIAQIMVGSYQILFAHYYTASNLKYARARKTVLESATRIFELLILKQQARALRYQLLGAHDWQLVNTVFYVMSRYEDVEQPLPTLRKRLELGGGHSDISLREQFALLHTVAQFDMLRWPTHLQWVIGSYLHGVENAVQIRLDDVKLGRNELIAYCYGSSPAGTKQVVKQTGPSIILNFQILTDTIRKDCLGLVQAKKNRNAALIPPRFARLPENEHFVISTQLINGLQYSSVDVAAEQKIKVEDLRIFVSFADVFSFLHHKQGKYATEERLADLLAKRSALIAEDHVATEESVWSLLFQSEKMIRLATQETRFTTPMTLGSLLAYGVGDDINRPSLAVVSRIFRPAPKEVVIDIQIVANYAEAVTFTVNAVESSLPKVTPALLVYSKARVGEWALMFPPQDILPGFDKLEMSRNNQSLVPELKSRLNATDDFYLFSTSLMSEQLGMAGEPDYPMPPTGKDHSHGLLL